MTEAEVVKIIGSMKPKHCELDVIPLTIFKLLLPKIGPIITKIVNLSLLNGVFCDQWKTALVKPLLKKANLELVKSNYRPVSNLPYISKIVEKCMLSQLNPYCVTNKLLPDYQSAYRAGYSCETLLLSMVNDILCSMESKEITAMAVMDLSAAFDTVDHSILLQILSHNFGISDNALQWFDSYLRPRCMQVKVNNCVSEKQPIDFSVPQGSCAGASFFNMYSSTLDEAIPKQLSLNGFADDHSVRKSFKPKCKDSELSVVREIETALVSAKNWMNSVRLKMNDSKTEFICFGNKIFTSKMSTSSINVNGTAVYKSEEIRLLGAWLDSELNFKRHITKKCCAAMVNLQKLKCIRPYLTKDTCETLVLTLCISHLDYANSLLIGLPDVTIAKLQRIQNMCAKVVLQQSKYSSSSTALKQLHWLPITFRIQFKIATMVYNCLHNKAPQYLKDLIQLQTIRHSGLRSNSTTQIQLPIRKRKTFANRSFSVQGPIIWNSLPADIRDSTSIDIFKKKLKTHYFNQFIHTSM